jgi:hypothetical protein
MLEFVELYDEVLDDGTAIDVAIDEYLRDWGMA